MKNNTLRKLIKAVMRFINPVVKHLKTWFKPIIIYITDSYAILRMRVSVNAARTVHRYIIKNEKYNELNNKNIRQYIVLLELPDKKRKKITERLWWINRRNFKKVKRMGWLPENMKLDELRHKAFYYTDMQRSYAEEYAAKKRATTKYVFYLRAKNGLL